MNNPTQHTYLRFKARRLLEEIDTEQAVDLLMELLAYREVGALKEIGELVDERDELSNEVEEKNAIIRDLDGTIAELEEELDDLRSRS